MKNRGSQSVTFHQFTRSSVWQYTSVCTLCMPKTFYALPNRRWRKLIKGFLSDPVVFMWFLSELMTTAVSVITLVSRAEQVAEVIYKQTLGKHWLKLLFSSI